MILTFISTQKCQMVGADSLAVSAPTYNTAELMVTRVWFPSIGPLPIQPPLSTQYFPVCSQLSHLKKKNA